MRPARRWWVLTWTKALLTWRRVRRPLPLSLGGSVGQEASRAYLILTRARTEYVATTLVGGEPPAFSTMTVRFSVSPALNLSMPDTTRSSAMTQELAVGLAAMPWLNTATMSFGSEFRARSSSA